MAKKNNFTVLVIEVIVVVLAIIGITFAINYLMDNININANTADLAVDYTGNLTLPSTSLFPVSDSSVATNTENVMRVNFTVKGASGNPTNKDIIYDVILSDLSIDCQLKSPYLKWQLNKNGEKLSEGSFSPTFDTIKDGKLYLTEIQQDLPSNSSTADSYEFIMWLSESCSDINNCTQEQDQSNMLNKTISGKIETILYTDSKKELVREPGDNPGCPNPPKLVDNMIPVKYDESKQSWVKADSTNKNEDWYSYDFKTKRWANAVLVSETNRSTYLSAEAGTVIPESEVLAYYVWIPRYKYKVFNVAKKMGTDSYNAKTTGIDIVFEEGTSSTGEIKCNNYSFAAASSSATNETCSGTNGQYYTHPAFTFGDTELTGIWVGKFESASSNPSASYGGSNSTTLTVRVKPNMNTWRNNPVSNFYTVIKNMQNNGNEYGLSTDTSKVDSHMLKNMEWGAVAYLTHSDYGRCSNGSCSEIGINNYYSGSGSSRQFKTGCGANAGSSSSGTCNEYTTSLGMNASSTGNIYGIYDLSGGAYEYVMGNMSSGSGSYTYNAKSAGSNFSYSASTAKYIDTYVYGTSNGDQTAYNRARLGDATGEVVSSSYTAWNNDYAFFVNSSFPWFQRGGNYSGGSDAGVFLFYYNGGNASSNSSARAALLAL